MSIRQSVGVIDLPCLEWQANFMEDPSDIRAVIGGIGSGKSIVCADELIERAMRYPRARHYIIGASHPTMKEGTIPTFCSRLDEHRFDYFINRQDLSVTITSGPAKGCRIIAWTVANDRFEKLKGQLIDSAWLDECQVWDRGQEAYEFIINRMRPSEEAQKHHPELEPRVWLSANPPHTTSHWLYRFFVLEKKAPLYHATVFENVLLPQREKYIERLRGQFSPALFKIEVQGEWGNLGVGAVYSSFSHPRHVRADVAGNAVEYDPAYPLVWMHDFGVTPRVSLLAQQWRVDIPGYQNELLVVLDEITIDPGSTMLQIEEFQNRLPADKVSMLVLDGDPAGSGRNSTTAQSDWEMLSSDPRLKSYNVAFDRLRRSPEVIDRVNAVNTKLENALGDVGVVVHPRCVRLIDDLQTTQWKPGTRILDHGRNNDKRTHWSDALGYRIYHKWPLIAKTEWSFASARNARI